MTEEILEMRKLLNSKAERWAFFGSSFSKESQITKTDLVDDRIMRCWRSANNICEESQADLQRSTKLDITGVNSVKWSLHIYDQHDSYQHYLRTARPQTFDRVS